MIHRRTSTFIAIAAVLLCLAPASAAFAPGNVVQTKLSLTRPVASPDDDAQGTLRLLTHTKQGRHRFELKAKDVDTSITHELFVETASESGAFLKAGNMAVAGGKHVAYLVDTKKGDLLPLGMPDNASFNGCRVQVRRGGATILECTVPGTPVIIDGINKPVRSKVRLRPPSLNPPVPKMKGKLRLRSFKKKSVQRFLLKTRRVPFEGRTFEVFLEEPVNSGSFVSVGELLQRGKTSKGRYRRNTKKGDALPLGVDYLVDLGNRAIQIRDQTDLVYLEGMIPTLD